MLRLPATLLRQAALCVLLAGQGYGDFYRYSGDDGVEVFTNTPTSRGAVKVLREGAVKKQPRQGPKVALTSAQFPTQEPLLPVNGTITSDYGWRHDPIDGGIRHHNGVDIAVPTGTGVKAIAAGRVIQSASRGGYGNLVSIDHGDGMVSLYGHNSQLMVSVGERVEAGQTVALSGSTGRSTGPHLHFELWSNGANVTRAYLKTGAGIPEVAGGIRSYLHSDGSIVFTNLN
ncbi:MAG: peptidase M23 [Geobacteraceae bacterium GWC2_58_44]|nr:MAG: peptidase M23 [Geobacteraceae bacterium GWC2_58_44]HBG07633.1 peptidase M23 [Geobacter sp.]